MSDFEVLTPVVVSCAFLGCYFDRKKGLNRSWKETIANVTMFLVNRVLFWWVFLASLKWIFIKFRPETTLPRETWVFIIALLVNDFLFYWRHRLEHRFQILWAQHCVHHNGNELNFATGLRLPWFTPFFGWFAIPLVCIGVPIDFIIVSMAVNLIFQYLVHNNDIPKLGPLEKIFCTPSNHRVHHGHNPQYIDKNFGGIFIFWDKLFGTYEPEGETPYYTSERSTQSTNPIWINVEPILRYLKVTR